MPTLLIVDDEPLITDDLVETFRERDYPGLVVRSCYSAVEALEILSTEPVEILLLDISMPGISGLELQERIVTRHPECKVIFLSGYSRFDYAQQAIHNKGFDYILKSEGDARIFDAVERALAELDSEAEANARAAKAGALRKRSEEVLREGFLRRFLEEDSSPALSNQELAEIGVQLSREYDVYVVVADVHPPQGSGVSLSERLMRSIERTVTDIIAIDPGPVGERSVGVALRSGRLVWLLQPEDGSALVVSRIEARLAEAVRRIRDALGVLIRFSGFAFPVPWEQVHSHLRFLELLPNRTNSRVATALLSHDDVERLPSLRSERNLPVVSEFKTLNLLQTYLERGERDSFFRVFATLSKSASDPSVRNRPICDGVYTAMASFALAFVGRWSLFETVAKSVDLRALTDRSRPTTTQEYVRQLEALIHAIFDSVDTEPDLHAHAAVARVRRHIDAHLGEDVSLTRLADLAGLNPSYLSRLFKRVVGNSVSEYITEKRLVRAEELLLTGTESIAKIASDVGFLTAPAFSRFFRRRRGVTPREFRERGRG